MQHHDEFARLRAAGYRLTPQRIHILDVVRRHAEQLTAEEIHAAVVPQQPSLDIATVYRTLVWLQEVGLVAPLTLGDGLLRYEYHPHGNHHHHLVCQRCGTSIQLPGETFAALQQQWAEQYGFVLDAHVTLSGLCASCQAASRHR